MITFMTHNCKPYETIPGPNPTAKIVSGVGSNINRVTYVAHLEQILKLHMQKISAEFICKDRTYWHS